MPVSPTLIETPERHTAVIHVTVPRAGIVRAMDAAMAELSHVMRDQGIPPDGPCFSLHRQRPQELFDFEVGFPVKQAVRPDGRVRSGVLPAARAVQALHTGSYDGLAAAWARCHAWIAQQGLLALGPIWECYALGPESGLPPECWETELFCPI